MKKILAFLIFILYVNQVKSQTDSITYIAIADSSPKYIYGDYQFSRFIQINMVTPDEARNKALKGKVFISFIVDTFGKVINPKILKDIGGGCGEAAIKVIQLTSGLWIPGIDKGKKINVLLTIPISFNFEEYPVNSRFIPNTDRDYHAKYYYDRGMEDLNANRILTAIFYFSKSLAQRPNYVNSLHFRGIAKLKNEDKHGACNDWNDALKLGDDSASELININCK